MLAQQLYYKVKPLIPRNLQVILRQRLVANQVQRFQNVWPIDNRAAESTKGFKGWPGGKRFALVLTHDVDTAIGQDKALALAQCDEEMGFRSSFNFVPERYQVASEVLAELRARGFEVGVHGLNHDGKLYSCREEFLERSKSINRYLKDWGAVGFRSPAMHCNPEWIHDLNIEYDSSTFDTDPFEPYPSGVCTILPFQVSGPSGSYMELPYTLPQDFTLFVLMQQKNIEIWKRKISWIAANGGLALVNVHPDYIDFDKTRSRNHTYPANLYRDFLAHVVSAYSGQYWHALPRDVARYCKDCQVGISHRKAEVDRIEVGRSNCPSEPSSECS